MSGRRWAAAAPVPVPSLLQVLLALQCGVVFLQCSAASAMSGDGECCFLLRFRSSFSTGNLCGFFSNSCRLNLLLFCLHSWNFSFLPFSLLPPDFFRFCVLICSLQKSVLAKYNRFAACDN